MAFVAPGSFGKQNQSGKGKDLLDGRVDRDALARQIADAASTTGVSGCGPNLFDTLDVIPRWLRERDSSEDANFIDLLQKYYDWLYCKGNSGGQYYLNSDDFYGLLNLDNIPIDALKLYASSYADDFPREKIGNVEDNAGITAENFADFLSNIRFGFYQRKGTEDSYRYFFKKLYGITLANDAIDYPKKNILRLNGGKILNWTGGGTGPYEEIGSLAGSYLNNAFIQDSYFYQDYSYTVNTGKVSDYDQALLAMIHPAGLQAFFEQSIQDYVPVGPSGDYTEGVKEGCEVTILGNYLPYQINATGDVQPCVGCSGSALNTSYFETQRGISSPTYDIPTFNHPGWALSYATQTASAGGIDKYDLAFSGVVIRDFTELCLPADGTTNPNDGISACDTLVCI